MALLTVAALFTVAFTAAWRDRGPPEIGTLRTAPRGASGAHTRLTLPDPTNIPPLPARQSCRAHARLDPCVPGSGRGSNTQVTVASSPLQALAGAVRRGA